MEMMNKKITLATLLTLVLLSCCNLFAQGKFEVKFVNNYREDAGIAYNFFIGNDAEDFATSINGFGSGFIIDMFTRRYSIDLITFGTESFNLSLGAGVAISKYRFSISKLFIYSYLKASAGFFLLADHEW